VREGESEGDIFNSSLLTKTGNLLLGETTPLAHPGELVQQWLPKTAISAAHC